MPIRHCQKCGLKVLVDESQLAANPFYCQRCAATAKAAAAKDGGPAMMAKTAEAAPPKGSNDATSPAQPAVTAPAPAAAKSIKVLCPYCKASFTGRVPAKPAKGSCPVCTKDLVLLPDGTIAAAGEFNLAKWQKEQAAKAAGADLEPIPMRSPDGKTVVASKLEARGTKIVRKPPTESAPVPDDAPAMPLGDGLGEHTMLDMGRPARAPARPAESEVEAAFPGAGLGEHTILDMGRPVSTPKGMSKPAPSEVEEAFPGGMVDQTMLDMGHREPPKPPPDAEPAFPDGMGDQTMLDMGGGGLERGGRQRAEPMPMPPPPPPPPPNEVNDETSSAPSVPVEPPPPAAPPPPEPPKPERQTSRHAPGPRPGMGKAIAAAILMLIQPAVAFGLWTQRENPSVKGIVDKIGPIAQTGLHKIYVELTKEPPPPPPKPVNVKDPADKPKEETPEEKAAKLQELKRTLEREITESYLKVMSAKKAIRSMPDPSEGQKKIIEQQQAIIDKHQKLLDEKQALYKKTFNEEYKPQDEEGPPK